MTIEPISVTHQDSDTCATYVLGPQKAKLLMYSTAEGTSYSFTFNGKRVDLDVDESNQLRAIVLGRGPLPDKTEGV